MFWIKEKFVSLHRKTEMKCSIGLWCNGNTTDSGPVIPGSNPGSPTITHQQRGCVKTLAQPHLYFKFCYIFFWLCYFFLMHLATSCYIPIISGYK